MLVSVVMLPFAAFELCVNGLFSQCTASPLRSAYYSTNHHMSRQSKVC